MAKRAALYLRISQDRDGEQLAIDRQREDGRKLVELRGWRLAVEHADNDTTASGRKRRPGFNALLEDIRGGAVDVVVAWALDRLARNARDRLALVDACRAREVSIALVRGSDIDLTTPAGRLTIGILGEVAAHEIDQKSDRQRRAIAQAAADGRVHGGQRPFGYREDGVTFHPVEAPLVEQLYDLFLTGASVGELADWLHLRCGVTTTAGGRWTRKAVRIVLGNPRYAGLRAHRPTDPLTGRRDPARARTYPAVWPPLVSEETWRAAVALLATTAQPGQSQGGNRHRHLLSGIARCGLCGHPMISGRTGRGVHRIYLCNTSRHLSRRADLLDAYVETLVIRRLCRPDAASLLAPDDGPSVDVLRGEAGELRGRLDGLATDYADGILDREQLQAASARLRARLVDVEAEIAHMGAPDPAAELIHAVDEEGAWAAWADYTMARKRMVVQRLVSVEVLRGRHGRPPIGQPFDPSSVVVRWL